MEHRLQSANFFVGYGGMTRADFATFDMNTKDGVNLREQISAQR